MIVKDGLGLSWRKGAASWRATTSPHNDTHSHSHQILHTLLGGQVRFHDDPVGLQRSSTSAWEPGHEPSQRTKDNPHHNVPRDGCARRRHLLLLSWQWTSIPEYFPGMLDCIDSACQQAGVSPSDQFPNLFLCSVDA